LFQTLSINPEVAMFIARIVLAGASALCVLTSVASAEPLTGRVMGINRLTNTIAIQQTQDGTVGANGGSATEEFKAQDGVSLENVHVEDRVTYSVAKSGGVKTITKIERQK
jgi:Copper binding periplasmic protein CusF